MRYEFTIRKKKRALQIVESEENKTISYLQRTMGIGYNRARVLRDIALRIIRVRRRRGIFRSKRRNNY